ncbi:2-methylaconitate cis-trans isomerase PrpF family protein [Piscinibacter koreensis]|uniref:PrpF family protein n=1 Tax=Piscinibacter koreensis TaxID=2742824 RepID=A0A7Y6NN21_9BURK|nr:PrpF domain-containing protein [Schlegelella koreensis]NUZ06104.1 PrpF family protein [Schlegelella koreensis]
MARRIPAAFIRGGTSKGLVFHRRDLPADRGEWDAIFLAAMGSPDRYGRQLNGMGGGVSSLSKVCIVDAPTRPGADIDYTFVQVQVKEARCEYRGNCGNMSSAMGPFAVDEGLVSAPRGDEALVRIHNTNTGKIIESRFAVAGGRSVETGELEIPGVHGRAAPVRLDFLEPGGASTGRLLPTGRACDRLDVAGIGAIDASMVDAANACVFVDAAALGLGGGELPDEIDADAGLMQRLEQIRRHASVAMGIAPSLDAAAGVRMLPLIAFVAAPRATITLAGEGIPADAADLVIRMLSNGQPHRAVPLTGALCTAVATLIDGSIPARLARPGREGPLRLAMPSGVLTVDARVRRDGSGWFAESGSFFRTTRRLFDGFVYA